MKFTNGGILPKQDKDKIPILLERGWYQCKKCKQIFEFDTLLIMHKCNRNIIGEQMEQIEVTAEVLRVLRSLQGNEKAKQILKRIKEHIPDATDEHIQEAVKYLIGKY